MEPEPRACGFYGKLISAGDFVRRGFPSDLYEQWDPWLQHGLLTSRQELGERWLSAYLSAPIWRFTLSPGIAGQRAWVGSLMPSVDRVGRYFPLTVVGEAPADTSVFAAARTAEPWLQAIEQVLLATLDGEGIAADALFERIAASSISWEGSAAEEAAADDERSLVIQTSRGPDSAAIACAVAGILAQRHLPQPLSLWWSAGSDQVSAGARLYTGLPVDEDFRRLLADDAPNGATSTASP